MDESSEVKSSAGANEAACLFEKDKTLLIVDDDKAFLNRLAKAMALRGFDVSTAETIMDGTRCGAKRAAGFRHHRYAAGRRQWSRCH